MREEIEMVVNHDVGHVMLSTHGDVHHIVVLHKGVDECVIDCSLYGQVVYNEQTWEPTGKLSDVRSEQKRCRRIAEGLAELYGVDLIVN